MITPSLDRINLWLKIGVGVLLLVSIIILILFASGVFKKDRKSTPSKPSPPILTREICGESCVKGTTTCKSHLYSSRCQYQKTPSNIICAATGGVKIIPHGSVGAGFKTLYYSTDGSISDTSALSTCYSTPGCQGVYFDGDKYQVLNSQMRVTLNDPSYNEDLQCQLYLMTGSKLLMDTKRVSLYQGVKPQRYYLDTEAEARIQGYQILNSVHSTSYKVSVPEGGEFNVVNDGNLTGAWSLTEFNPRDFKGVLKSSLSFTDVGSKYSTYTLSLPVKFQGRVAYVYYASVS
jgi:hypothetical protein